MFPSTNFTFRHKDHIKRDFTGFQQLWDLQTEVGFDNKLKGC